jgi:hypothetical protein
MPRGPCDGYFSCLCRIHKLFNNSFRNFLWGPASFFNSMGCGENIQCTHPRRKDDPKETHLFISRKLQKQPTGRDFCPLSWDWILLFPRGCYYYYYFINMDIWISLCVPWLISWLLKLTTIQTSSNYHINNHRAWIWDTWLESETTRRVNPLVSHTVINL